MAMAYLLANHGESGRMPVKLHAKLQCLGDLDHLDGVAVPVARIGGGCV